MKPIDCELDICNDFNNWRFDTSEINALVEASGAVERLDEQVKRSSIGPAWSKRILFRQACACQLAQGRLVHEDELIGCDAGTRRVHGYPELADTLEMLHVWQAALDHDANELLRADRPGLCNLDTRSPFPVFRRPVRFIGGLADGGAAADVEIDQSKCEQWQRIWRNSKGLPPVLAAAIAWEGWCVLIPEPSSGWRASLLASLVLRAQGVTPNLLLPIDIGWKASPYRVLPRHSRREKLLGFVNWIAAAATQSQKDLATLSMAYIQLRSRLRGRYKNSRLPALARLFMSVPLVSVPIAARHLGCSSQAVEKMIPLLGSTVRQVTDGNRYRAWTVS